MYQVEILVADFLTRKKKPSCLRGSGQEGQRLGLLGLLRVFFVCVFALCELSVGKHLGAHVPIGDGVVGLLLICYAGQVRKTTLDRTSTTFINELAFSRR